MKVLVDIDHTCGDTVYRKLDPEEPGVVTGVLLRPTGPLYYVTWKKGDEGTHFAIELQTEKGFS